METSSFAVAAAEAGADRLEVCDRLDLDGLTPQLGVVESALGTSASVVVMLRDRIPRSHTLVITFRTSAVLVDGSSSECGLLLNGPAT